MRDLCIRAGVPADLAALREVFRRASLSNDGEAATLLAHPEALVWTGVGLAEGRTRVASWTSDLVVGFATTSQVGDIFELEDLFVDPDWMRRGIGRCLVRDAVAAARQRHGQRIDVTANPHALAFYASVGFVRVGTVETQFGSGIRMQLDVEPA